MGPLRRWSKPARRRRLEPFGCRIITVVARVHWLYVLARSRPQLLDMSHSAPPFSPASRSQADTERQLTGSERQPTEMTGADQLAWLLDVLGNLWLTSTVPLLPDHAIFTVEGPEAAMTLPGDGQRFHVSEMAGRLDSLRTGWAIGRRGVASPLRFLSLPPRACPKSFRRRRTSRGERLTRSVRQEKAAFEIGSHSHAYRQTPNNVASTVCLAWNACHTIFSARSPWS